MSEMWFEIDEMQLKPISGQLFNSDRVDVRIVRVWDKARDCERLIPQTLPLSVFDEARFELCRIMNEAASGGDPEPCIRAIHSLRLDLLFEQLAVRRRAFLLGVYECGATALAGLIVLGVFWAVYSLDVGGALDLPSALLWNKVENVIASVGWVLVGMAPAIFVRRHIAATFMEYSFSHQLVLSGNRTVIKALGNFALAFVFVLALLLGVSVFGVQIGSLKHVAVPGTAIAPGFLFGLIAPRMQGSPIFRQ